MTCWFHDQAELGQPARLPRFTYNRDPHYPYLKLQGTYKTNHPCPGCRDWGILINYKNVDLLNQFIDPKTGLQLPPFKTSLCMFQHGRMAQTIEASRMLGHLEYPTVDPDWTEYKVEDYEMTYKTTGCK